MGKSAYNQRSDRHDDKYLEKVIKIDRVNKVVKGGKRMSFRAFIITGDQEGMVGLATGKSKEVPVAIRKASEKAKKQFKSINIIDRTVRCTSRRHICSTC